MKINKLLIATHNSGKFEEIKKQLSSLNIELLSLNDLDINEDPEETGQTFEDNALLKVKYYYQLAKMPVLSDDGGLEVDALGGQPGVESRRWGGQRLSDQELIDKMFVAMKDIPTERRIAKFVDVVAVYDGQEIITERGECQGIIATELVCPIKPGVPWSSIFYPEGSDKVFTQLTPEEKSRLSHRGKALEKVIKKLKYG
ncbi:non-canonical purine NTP pyrophosphatase [Patescibacteria group bacterium]|nr:non-canonical purine NTP pyrophosphatase [Patescibacteria group bacterium]